MDESAATQFHLWQNFVAHSSDVKAVEPTTQGHLATVSRDETAKMWVLKENGYAQEALFKNGQHVNSVAFYETESDGEFIVCGRKDGTIALFSPTSAEPVAVIKAHNMNVCALRVDNATGRCISGSWDAKAVVTDLKKALAGQSSQIYSLNGHKHSVWAVEFVPHQTDCFVTGSADRTIKLWRGNECIKTLEGHQDVVRSVIVLSNGNIISSANDSTLRLWSSDSGKCLEAYDSYHGEFIYSTVLINHPCGRSFVASCSERGYIEVYSLEAENSALRFLQPVRIPAVSLWSIRSMRNGDFVVAADNGFIYVFSMDPERKAPEPVEAAFEVEVSEFIAKEVAAKAAEQQDKVTIKVSLDDSGRQLDLVYTKGQNPIDTAKHFLTQNNLPISYLNEIVDYIKTHIPEAKNFEQFKSTKPAVVKPGKADYEFEISTSENNTFFLSYNVGEDPNMAAQRCCEQNKLPIAFIPQLVRHIQTNVPELKGLQGSAYADPFTGGGRYVPGQTASSSGDYGDPFTSGGRYIPGQSASNSSVGGGDPYTSGGRYIPSQGANDLVPNASLPVDKKKPTSEFVPIKDLILFSDKADQKAIDALKKANSEVGAEFELEEPLIESLVQMFQPDFEYNEIQTLALEKALQWPMEKIMSVVDVFRYALLNETHNASFCLPPNGDQTLERLLTLLISDQTFKIRTMVCRAFANACKHDAGRQLLLRRLNDVAEVVGTCILWEKPILQQAAVSVFCNLAYSLLKQTEGGVAEIGPREDLLRAIIKATEGTISFSHLSALTIFRLLQCIVTLMWGDSTVIKMGKQRGVSEIVQRIKDATTEEASKNIARDIYVMTFEV
ncbi:unnamed protein product [Bursaphelenchus okinawaensis]|uniref:Phospholipase A-2-activating protein n=1 Tax=Bursaphelenchus okinawaensis TaxID=465554 RepID=A0A811KD76_9BILA|nr:unnamed protein product [Bursaphelenchus okinawaensis]CAG9099494.1 unnamed protein product [Bursaphelenchus okinawaensis]